MRSRNAPAGEGRDNSLPAQPMVRFGQPLPKLK